MKWKISFLLLGFVSLFTLFSPTAHAVESYAISPEDDREFRRSIYNELYSPNFNVHYYFIAENNYAENLKVIAWTCSYKDGYDDSGNNKISTLSNCGISFVQEGGYFKVKLKASYWKELTYSRRTSKVTYSSGLSNLTYYNFTSDIASYTDEHFKQGLTLLGGTTPLINNWNLEEGGFIVDPINGGSNSGNSSGGGLNLDLGAFVNGIINGIKEFFTPMFRDVSFALDQVGSKVSDAQKATFDTLGKVWDFLSNFFEQAIDFIKHLIIPKEEELQAKYENINNKVKSTFEPFNNILTIKIAPAEVISNCSGGIPSGLTGPDHNPSGINGFLSIMEINLCRIPQPLLFLARNLLYFTLTLWFINRVLSALPVLLGSFYVWERYTNKEDK